jgi:hypothetical protein
MDDDIDSDDNQPSHVQAEAERTGNAFAGSHLWWNTVWQWLLEYNNHYWVLC